MNNDNDLMQLVKQKDDKEAFEKLIKKYRQYAINYANKIIKDMYVAEDKDYIKEILNVLSDNERKILYMYAVCGMSYKDISYTLNKSLSGINITIYRARKKLKNYNINLNEVTL